MNGVTHVRSKEILHSSLVNYASFELNVVTCYRSALVTIKQDSTPTLESLIAMARGQFPENPETFRAPHHLK